MRARAVINSGLTMAEEGERGTCVTPDLEQLRTRLRCIDLLNCGVANSKSGSSTSSSRMNRARLGNLPARKHLCEPV